MLTVLTQKSLSVSRPVEWAKRDGGMFGHTLS
jgi:hypothetical protein